MTIRCVTFDLDDTLWECRPIIIKAETALNSWIGQNYPRISEKYSSDELLAQRMAYTKSRPEMRHNLTQIRKDWLKQLAEEHQYHESMIEEGFQVFWNERNNVTFHDGILETLMELQKDFTLGVITNGNADVNHIGVGHLFEFSIKSEQAGVSKPHPTIFELAVEKANVPAEQILHIGDDPIGDIKGAQDVGMKTLWVNYSRLEWKEDYQPDGVIHQPDEILQAIQNVHTKVSVSF